MGSHGFPKVYRWELLTQKTPCPFVLIINREEEGKRRSSQTVDGGDCKAQNGTFMETLNDAAAFFLPSKLLHPLSDALPFLKYPGGGQLLRLLLRCLLSAFHCLLYLLFHLPSHLHPPPPHTLASGSAVAPLADASRAGRGLSRVLFAVAHVPVASRKYDFVRSLAERILDDNLRATGGADLQTLNCTVLSAAFARTLHGLEEALAAEAASANGVRSRGQIMGALKSRVRAWAAGRLVPPAGEAGAGVSAEKLAAEAMWLGQKMAENGAAAEGVAMWGAASRLAGLAVSAEPRLQVALVRVCGENSLVKERAEMVSLLGDMIGKFNWDQQEEVLSLWLYHFTNCPDSDWPNLESCYMRWYLESQELFFK
ncbi:hypothetical protein BHE74_00052185 [Ensete ventricosum]|nr:hypothetical protein BHE74_00052185 [Ensete ventricosum]